jgi:spoIIIJ-associated protein
MSSEIIEIEEKSIDEAIEKACLQFGVPREKLNIEIISGESGGFMGLFSKKAKIKASLLALDMDFSFADKPPERKKEIRTNIEPRNKIEKEIITEQTPAKAETEPEEIYIPTSPGAVQAKDLLDAILKRISPEYSATVSETKEKIILSIAGDESGLLIGKHGQTLDALQYILNKAVNKVSVEHKMILIDSGEYRKRREEFLKNLAEKIRKKVRKTRKPVSLSNMNAHDRRVIHLFLQEDESLVTQSRGEGKFRKIVILPAKTGNSRRAREKKRD